MQHRLYSSGIMKIPSCDFIPKLYSGLDTQKLTEIRTNNIVTGHKHLYSKPVLLHQGYKQWLFDANGKRYLDLFGGICTVSVGHCHPKFTNAITEQLKTLHHVSTLFYYSKNAEYVEKLTSKMPGNLKVVFMVNSGSEANDLAILLARSYTKRYDIVGLRNGFHGMTSQVMALTASGSYKHPVPQLPGVHHVMNPDVYHGIWGGSNCRDSPAQTTRTCECKGNTCEAKDKYYEQFEELFAHTLNKQSLAGFFAESIQGVGGIVQYPKGYLKEVRKYVKENGGLFISDEVQTGFGRTGDHFWGFEGHDIIPDIVTMAKGIGNGISLGAVVTTPEIANSLKAGFFNTYGGNPIASAAGLAVLEIIEEEKLQENSKVVGNYFFEEIKKLQSEFKVIGDVRGKGLMIGIEMVNKDGSASPLAPEKFSAMINFCKENRLLLGVGGPGANVLRIQPPMCITKADAEFALSVLREGISRI